MRRTQTRLIGGAAVLMACGVAPSVWASSPSAPTFSMARAYFTSHPESGKPEATTMPVVVPPATPDGPCGPGSLPETTQGRAPLIDFSTGRAAQGYTCNAVEVSHTGTTGGYRTHVYTDLQGHTCAYYDTTNVYGVSLATHGEYGTAVVDMTDPVHPVQTARLMTQAFAMPHESMTISPERGLLMAASATNATGPALVDVYSLKDDCRYPQLMTSSPYGILGHEGNVTADGKTFWVSSNALGIVAAVDITNPASPGLAYFSAGSLVIHGLSLSPDGNLLYGAANGGFKGVQIFDVRQVQARTIAPVVTQIGQVTWPEVSVPQTTMPIVVNGHNYLVEVDEYAGNVTNTPTDPVGAARIIDVQDPRHPFVVSHLRLQVDEPQNRLGEQVNDPNANNQFVGYAAHYCSVPRPVNPELVACSFLASGLRIFNISDPLHPVEVAYFNHPADYPGDTSGSSSFSQPSWDLVHQSVYFSDSNHGFFDVRLTNGVWPSDLTAPPAARGRVSHHLISRVIDEDGQAVSNETVPAYNYVYDLMGK